MAVETLTFNVKETNYKSMLYLRRYGLKSKTGKKNISSFFVFYTIKFTVILTKNKIEAYKLTLILILMSAIHVKRFRRIHEGTASVIPI